MKLIGSVLCLMGFHGAILPARAMMLKPGRYMTFWFCDRCGRVWDQQEER